MLSGCIKGTDSAIDWTIPLSTKPQVYISIPDYQIYCPGIFHRKVVQGKIRPMIRGHFKVDNNRPVEWRSYTICISKAWIILFLSARVLLLSM